MKKLIALLGTLAITSITSGNILNNVKINSHFPQNQLLKKRNLKINSDRENAIEFQQNWYSSADYGMMYASFTPTFWEEIGYLQGTANNREQFIEWFKNKVTNGVWIDHRLEGPIHDSSYQGVKGLGGSIWDNWTNINNTWQQSSKTKMMRVEVEKAHNPRIGEFSFIFKNSSIRSENIFLPNPYLDNIKRDLNGDYDKDIVNLGIVGFYQYDHILKAALKKKYPVLRTEQISIINETDYNPNENYTQSFKIRVNGNSQHYSHGDLKLKFIFTTEQFLEYILPNLLKENGRDLLQDWQNNFNNWIARINRQISEDIPSFTEAQKRTWQDQQCTTLEDKLHDLLQNWEIIDLKMKQKHLYEAVKVIQDDLGNVKNKLDELTKIIKNLQSQKNKAIAWTSSITGFVARLAKWIPVVGAGASELLGIASSVTSIINVAN